jgi:multidrug efflux pump subunit AcrA (membrane-fusion protein)
MNEPSRKSQKALARHSRLSRIGSLLTGLALLVAGYVGLHGLRSHGAATGTPSEGARNVGPIPVTVAKVVKGDFPVFLNGLGTVQPYDTVTVRSRVDGEVTTVSFRQGQMVKEGDVLVQIDPRPYQAALDGALAKMAQDEACARHGIELRWTADAVAGQAGARQQPGR